MRRTRTAKFNSLIEMLDTLRTMGFAVQGTNELILRGRPIGHIDTMAGLITFDYTIDPNRRIGSKELAR